MLKIGKIVNTHGIKGELRVLSNSDFIDVRFKPNAKIYIDNNEYIIEDGYLHKNFVIIKLLGFDNINDVVKFKNKDIYGDILDQDVLEEDEYFNQDLEGCSVYNQDNQLRGEVIEVMIGGIYNMLRIKGDNTKGIIPFNNQFIKSVDIDNKKIVINEIKGLIDED